MKKSWGDLPPHGPETPWLTTEEKTKAGTYYVVGIYDPELLRSIGAPHHDYEVIASNLSEAIIKAESMHRDRYGGIHEGVRATAKKMYGYSTMEPYEYIGEPEGVQKVQVKDIKGEALLEHIWNSGPIAQGLYMKYWEPDMTTETLIQLLSSYEPDWFQSWSHEFIEEWNVAI